MADGVLSNIAASIITKLGSLVLQEMVLLWGVDDELEKLQRTVSTIKAVLLDAENQSSTNNQVKVWLDDLKDVVYDTDDLLGDISTEASRLQLMSGNVMTKEVRLFFSRSNRVTYGLMTKEVRLFFSRSNRVTYGLKMARKIKNVRAKLDAIAENRKFHLSPNQVAIVDHLRDVGTHSSPPSVVIGRDDDRKNIISLLLGDHQEAVVVIPIVGFGGLGKTTLAQTVYNDELVKAHFVLRIWVCVSDTFSVRSILEKVIECVDGEKTSQNLQVETLLNKFSERAKGKKYLLVLDDVWNEDREKWLQLNHLISGGARGSRVVITTRSTAVAEITSTMQSYQLKGMSEVESWDLFQQVAFKQGKATNEEFEVIGKEIVGKCCGLPLAIRTIGSFLYSRNEASEWKHFSNEEFSKLDPKSQMVETLKLSYTHLPSNLKQCFSYCSLFPKDYLFEVPTLINHWRAQGYIDEDSGANCFKYLLQGSFFQLASENDLGDKVTYRMHDFMHDLAVLVAGEVSSMVYPDSNQKAFTGKTRHMSLHEIPEEQQWQHLAPLLQRRKARTLIVERRYCPWDGFTKSGDKQSREVVDKLRSLRVLTLQRCLIYTFPSLIDRLNHLAHLDLSGNKMQKLPDSITRLQNLQVLILDDCYKLRKLPRDIHKLVNLIQLGLEGCSSLKEMPRGIGQLTSLEVLSQFSLSNRRKRHANGGLDELHGLNNLRGRLQILNLQYGKKGVREFEAANLKEKSHLRYLILEWGFNHKAEDTSSEERSLAALQPHGNLRELRFHGYGGGSLPKWVSSLENLVKISISGCINCKSLSPLDGLPSLQHLCALKLFELEYIIDNNNENTKGGGRWSCFFPSLKTLILQVCPKLKGWWRSREEQVDYQLPCLFKLEIVMCPNFKGWMPLLPSLSSLSLWETSSELVEETLQHAKSPSTGTSTSTSRSPLRFLSIREIEGLGFMREEALQGLTSLKELNIGRLIETSFLVPWLHYLSSLESLHIWECPNQGEDWSFISHIPNIQVEHKLVQCNGRYEL